MNIVDVIIILIILSGAVAGFKMGFTKTVVKTIGYIAVIVLAYIFKNPVSTFLYEKLPFLNFGMIKNTEIINVLLYEIVAFLICLAVLIIALKILIKITSVFEKVLDATIILGIPSKLAGALVGIIFTYILTFVAAYAVTLLYIGNEQIDNSKLRKFILNETPVLSGFIDNTMNVIEEFNDLKDNYSNPNIAENDFNYKAFELFLKYDVIKAETLEKLVSNGKVAVFDGYEELVNRYKEI